MALWDENKIGLYNDQVYSNKCFTFETTQPNWKAEMLGQFSFCIDFDAGLEYVMPMNCRSKFVTQLVKRGDPRAEEFDRNFWAQAGAEAKFAASWEMVQEVDLFRGKKDAGEPRLQRSVQAVKRREC